MMDADGSQLGERRRAAWIARQYLAKEVTFEALAEELGESVDPDIEELFDLLEHEPAVGGFFGISASRHLKYVRDIERVLLCLDGG